MVSINQHYSFIPCSYFLWYYYVNMYNFQQAPYATSSKGVTKINNMRKYKITFKLLLQGEVTLHMFLIFEDLCQISVLILGEFERIN